MKKSTASPKQKPKLDTQKELKNKLIEIFERMPIVQVGVSKMGISRATYYRMRIADADFKERADNALMEGRQYTADIVESKLLKKIDQEENLTAIIFFLKHNSKIYNQKLEIVIDEPGVKFSEEEIKEILRAREFSGLVNIIKREKEMRKKFMKAVEELDPTDEEGFQKLTKDIEKDLEDN